MRNLPIEVLIDNKSKYLSENYQKFIKMKSDGMSDNAIKKIVDVEEVQGFHNSRVLSLDEFDFPHAVAAFDAEYNEMALRAVFKKCLKKSNLDSYKKSGITIILTTKFLFVAPLVREYATVRGTKVMVEPLAYVGLLNQ